MNILLAVHHFPPRHNEGAEQRALRTALALRARGHSVRVVCVGNPDMHGARGLTWEDREHCGIAVRELFFQRKALPWQAEFDNRLIGEHIREMLTAEHFDLLHLFSGYLMTGSPLLVARELGVPSAVSLTDFWFLCQRIQMLRSDGSLSKIPIKAATCARCIAEDSRRYRLPAQVAPALATAFWRNARERTARVAARMQLLNEALGSAAFVISPSRFLRNIFIETGVNPHQIVFSRQGREFSTIAPALLKKTPAATLRLGYLGQIIPVKGVHVAIDAMAQLRDLPVSLDIYGPTGHDTGYARRCAASAAADERIKMHGAYERGALTRVLQSLDVLIVPSTWYENSPNVILEAMAHKTPVITSNLGGMSELVQHEHNGLVFETGNALDLSRQVRRLLDSPELRTRLSAEIMPVKTVQEEIDEIEALYAQATGTAQLRRFDATTAHIAPRSSTLTPREGLHSGHMFKIGDFSRMAQVSVRTLRLYDENGLIKPAAVDRFTDYRYYTIEQLPRLNRIIALKDLGFSLDQIGKLLRDNISNEQFKGMLMLKQAEIEQELHANQARMCRIAARLRMIEQEDRPHDYVLTLKSVPAMTIASMRKIVPSIDDMGVTCVQHFLQLYDWLHEKRIDIADPELDLFHTAEYVERNIDMEMATAIMPPRCALGAMGNVTIRDLPAEANMLSVIHEGCWPDEIHAIQAMFVWLQTHNHQPAGPLREVHLSAREPAIYQAEVVTIELQLPVIPAA